MKSMLVSIAVALMFCASPVSSAEFPKTGEAEYDTYYVGNFVAKIDSGVGTSSIVDETGSNRNVKGEGPFHDMSVRFLYHMSSVGAVGPHLFENAVGSRSSFESFRTANVARIGWRSAFFYPRPSLCFSKTPLPL